jgi:hypothetical protein
MLYVRDAGDAMGEYYVSGRFDAERLRGAAGDDITILGLEP